METEPLIHHSSLDINADRNDNRDTRESYKSVDNRDDQQKIEHRTQTHVYRLRWYILLVFSLSTTLQNAAWGTWGPIAQSAKPAYNWSTSLLTVIINSGNVGVFLGLIPAACLVNFRGLRPAVIVCTFCLALGTGLRAISVQPHLATPLIGAGQFFIGVAGSVTTIIPSVISETWFPVNERTTATAIGIISNAVGGIVAFLLGPNIVKQPSTNKTSESINETNSNSTDTDTIKEEIRLLLLIEFIWGATLLVVSVIYFPTKPRLPPSQSASVKRLAFGDAFRGMIRKPGVVQISLVCAIPWACFGNWLGLISLIFGNVGVSQIDAGWYGFYACASGTIAGMIISRIIDVFRRNHKMVLLILYTSALLFIVWITAISNKYIPASHAVPAVAISLLSVSLNSAMPVLYEVACEIAYPVGEEMIGLFIGIVKNATAVIFLLAGVIQNIGTQWMNWTVLGVIAASIPVLVSVRIQYNRINLDSVSSH